MSGIYIPNMQMPTNCCQCPVNMELCKRGYKYLLEHPELYDERAKDCPLIPVPDHGRLIDADALITAWHYDDHDVCVVDFEDIANAPTIIPSNGKDSAE